MRSQIDWNEIVPRLAVGLQQTLYLEAVKLITQEAPVPSLYNKKVRVYRTTQAQRDYAREYWRRKHKAKGGKPRRLWSVEEKKKILQFFEENGFPSTEEKFGVTSSMVSRWRRGIDVTKTRTQAKANGASG